MQLRYLAIIIILLSNQALFASLKPYESTYELLQENKRIGSASRNLIKIDTATWRMETKSKARLFFVKVTYSESAEFKFQDGLVVPQSYNRLSDTSLSSERRLQQSFDWANGKDTGTYKGKPWTHELQSGSHSRVSDIIQFQEQLKLSSNPIPEAAFDINYRGNTKTETYVFEQKEEIKTPSGTYQALKYKKVHSNPERISNYWFVPELDYIPARIQQFNKGEEQANMLLKTISFK